MLKNVQDYFIHARLRKMFVFHVSVGKLKLPKVTYISVVLLEFTESKNKKSKDRLSLTIAIV